jgi:anti-sigma regulatory factor (Ser/Thr protein kinase)
LAPGRALLSVVLPLVVLVLALVGLVAWRGYQSAVALEVRRTEATAERAAFSLERFLDTRLAFLAFVAAQVDDTTTPAQLRTLLDDAARANLDLADGVGWVDAEGVLQAESGAPPGALPLDVSDRRYVRDVLRTGRPVVSDALVGRLSGDTIVVLAVPTRDAARSVTGMLIGSVRVEAVARGLPPSPTDRTVVHLLDTGRRLAATGTQAGSLRRLDVDVGAEPTAWWGPGVIGDDQLLVSMAAGDRGWGVLAERDSAAVVVPARIRLATELVAAVAFAAAGLIAGVLGARRLDRAQQQAAQRARELTAMEWLAERIGTARSTTDVAQAAAQVFADTFAAEQVVVGVLDPHRDLVTLVADRGIDPATMRERRQLPLSTRTLITDAIRTERTHVVTADEWRDRYPDTAREVQERGVAGGMAAPFRGAGASGAVSLGFLHTFPPPASSVGLFTSMVGLLADALGRAAAMDAEQAAIRTFQQSLLPVDRLAIELPVQRARRYRPATRPMDVGGDWYDLFDRPDGRVVAIIGDVVGRGVAAAAVMGPLSGMLRTAACLVDSPAEVLRRADQLVQQLPGAVASTVLVATLDPRTGECELASAGHVPPVLVSPSSTVEVCAQVRGVPLGVLRDGAHRHNTTVMLPEESTLVLYTDGLVERRPEGVDVGIDRLVTVLAEHGQLPVHQLADHLLVACLPEHEPAEDDVALVLLRRVGPVPRAFSASIAPSVPEVRRLRERLHAWLAARDHGAIVEDVVLATHEAVANAVEHGYGHRPDGAGLRGRPVGRIDVEVQPLPGEPSGVRVSVNDSGRWQPASVARGRGLGLRIMERIASDLVVDTDEHGTRVQFTVLDPLSRVASHAVVDAPTP